MSRDLEPCRICGSINRLMVYYEDCYWFITCIACRNIVAGKELLETMLRWDYEQTKEIQDLDKDTERPNQ